MEFNGITFALFFELLLLSKIRTLAASGALLGPIPPIPKGEVPFPSFPSEGALRRKGGSEAGGLLRFQNSKGPIPSLPKGREGEVPCSDPEGSFGEQQGSEGGTSQVHTTMT